MEWLSHTPLLNKLAFASFVVAKMLGLAGVALGFSEYRYAGGALLVAAGISLLSCIVLCIIQMTKQGKQDQRDEDAVGRMLKDGRLQDRLRQAGYQI